MDLVKKIEELREKRAKGIADARVFAERADTEKRDMSADENASFDKAHKDAVELKRQIDQLETQLSAERAEGQRATAPAIPGTQETGETRSTKEYRESFERFLRVGPSALNETEARAMQADSDTGGGYLIAPLQMVNELLKTVDDATVIRQVARKFTLNKAKSLGVPTMTTKMDDADWTSELATGSESAVAFGGRELTPHPLAKLAKISNTLIRNSGMSIEGIVNAELARLFGSAEEKAYMTGDGNKKPLGLFTASDNGIGTARDVSTGNTATAVTFDGFKSAKGTLKQQYRRNAQWLMHRDLVTATSKLKDGNGQYIWQASVVAGDPDKLLNLPILESEYAPNTYTAGLYAAIVGDFSYYWIVDALDMAVQRLVELYALSNQIGFLGRRELDAAPVMAEAFVRVKMG